jgi:hypothetical protein
MKRSAILDVVLVSAFLIGTTAVFALVRGVPGRCPGPGPSSVERLFAPCLVAEREEYGRLPGGVAAIDLPPFPLRPGPTAIADGPRGGPVADVEATGSLRR